MKLTLAKDLYPKAAVLKAAYHFTDRAYLYIRQDKNNYLIDMEVKEEQPAITEQEFKNELLSQAVRYEIYLQTKDVRRLIVQRALASTIVGEQTEVIEPQAAYSESDILKDWFEHENTEI